MSDESQSGFGAIVQAAAEGRLDIVYDGKVYEDCKELDYDIHIIGGSRTYLDSSAVFAGTVKILEPTTIDIGRDLPEHYYSDMSEHECLSLFGSCFKDSDGRIIRPELVIWEDGTYRISDE
jgi:hypothetical protein